MNDPVVIEPQPDSIRDLPASLVNANEEHAFDATEDAVRDLTYAKPDSNTDPYIIAKIGQLEAEHNTLVKAFAELQAKLARHFPALF